MNKSLAAMAAAGFVVFGAAAARAQILAESSPFAANGVHNRAINEPVEFWFSVYDVQNWDFRDPLPASQERAVFDRLSIGEEHVGQTIFVPASAIPGAVELLTNRVNNVVQARLSTGNGIVSTTRPESPFLFNTYPGVPAPGQVDFAGQEVTGIGVKVGKMRLNETTPGNYDFSLTVVVVPEPAALGVLGLGTLVLLRRRRSPL